MDAIEQLKSVLCDPEGKCCIAGSDEDRAIIDRALQALAQRKPLTPKEIAAFVGTHEFGPEQLKWFRLGEVAHGIKENKHD